MTPSSGEPPWYVIVIFDPGAGMSLTDESLWPLNECIRDAPQVEADMPGSRAVVCEVRPVPGDLAARARAEDAGCQRLS